MRHNNGATSRQYEEWLRGLKAERWMPPAKDTVLLWLSGGVLVFAAVCIVYWG